MPLSKHLSDAALEKVTIDEFLVFEEDMNRVETEAGKAIMAMAWIAHNGNKEKESS